MRITISFLAMIILTATAYAALPTASTTTSASTTDSASKPPAPKTLPPKGSITPASGKQPAANTDENTKMPASGAVTAPKTR